MSDERISELQNIIDNYGKRIVILENQYEGCSYTNELKERIEKLEQQMKSMEDWRFKSLEGQPSKGNEHEVEDYYFPKEKAAGGETEMSEDKTETEIIEILKRFCTQQDLESYSISLVRRSFTGIYNVIIHKEVK